MTASSTLLTDEDELLHRQAHPHFVSEDGIPSSAVFRPTSKDEGQLSLDRDSLSSPEESHVRHVSNGFSSNSVWSLAVREYTAVRAHAHSDPIDGNASHCYADFSSMSKGERERASKILKDKAVEAGKSY